MPAPIATVGRAGLDTMVLSNPLADFAVNTIGIEVVPEPIEAGCIVGEIPVEISNRVLSHFIRHMLTPLPITLA
jgi:hypothetical protein